MSLIWWSIPGIQEPGSISIDLLWSKYDPLWNWIQNNGTDKFSLTYTEIEKIAGYPIDHSFLTYKKELTEYGYKVGKISMKEQKVILEKVVRVGNRGRKLKLYYLDVVLRWRSILELRI